RHPCSASAAPGLRDAGRFHPGRRPAAADPDLVGGRSTMDPRARWQGMVLRRVARPAVDRRRQPAVLPAAAPGRRRLRLVQQLPGAVDGRRLGLLPARRAAELERAGRTGADPQRTRSGALAEAISHPRADLVAIAAHCGILSMVTTAVDQSMALS